MPVEIIETTDSLTGMIRFVRSPVYEMLVSLHTLLAGHRHLEWAAQARAALGRAFWAELQTAYGPFQNGVALFELPVNYAAHEDVPGFIGYVRAMDPATFVFYCIGRIIPVDELISSDLDPQFIRARLAAYGESEGHHSSESYLEMLSELLSDIAGYQAHVTSLWERYWNIFFQAHIQAKNLTEKWAKAIGEKQRILDKDGGRALVEFISGKYYLSSNLPPGQPIAEVVCVPIYYVTSPSYLFYGYGNVTIFFNSESTVDRRSEIEHQRDEALQISKALSDPTRLSILRIIALHDGRMNGKKIAERLDLSPSSISRQLAQLRDSGLLSEEHHDDQSVTYRLIKEAIKSLPDKLFDYLYVDSH